MSGRKQAGKCFQSMGKSQLQLHMMQVDDDATTEEVKSAYRNLAKVCHPDFTGDAGHNLCILLNEVSFPP
jgi:DnaJ-class molecular chaperone